MLEVRKFTESIDLSASCASAFCATCGRPSFDDPDMKRISFGTGANAISVCLCGMCTDQLRGVLSIIC